MLATYEGQQYTTTGTFPAGHRTAACPRCGRPPGDRCARDLLHLHRAGTLVLDIDLADYIVHADGAASRDLAKRTILGLTPPEVDDRVLHELLPAVDDAWQQVLADTPPTAVVLSGGGLHLYLWLDPDEGYGEQRATVRAVNRELGRRLNVAAPYPLVDLATTDAGTRLLRPVGTLHTKNPARPLPVRLYGSITGSRVSARALHRAWGLDAPARPAVPRPRPPSPERPNSPPPLPPAPDGADPAASARALLREDPLFRWAAALPTAVGREAWRVLATNLLAAAGGDLAATRPLFHWLSGLDTARYDPAATDAFLEAAADSLRQDGPLTYGRLFAVEGEPLRATLFPPGSPRPPDSSSPAGEHARRAHARQKAAAAGLPAGLATSGLPDNPAAARAFGPYERGDDVELGTDLADRYGRDRTVHDLGRTYAYDGGSGCWAPLPAHAMERGAHAYAGSRVRVGTTSDGQASYRPLRVDDGRARGIAAVCRRELSRPGFLERPTPGAAFRNGFLGLDGVLRPHDPAHRARGDAALPYPYTPAAVPAAFVMFLQSLWRGDPDADAKIRVLREFVGACLLGTATVYQRALVLVGERASNGKSTLLAVIASLFPPGSVTAIAPHDMAQEYRKALLARARLNLVSEVPARTLDDPDVLKAVVTGDLVTGREIRGTPFDFRPTAGHLFACNALPPSADTTEAFWRRVVIVGCHNRFVLPPTPTSDRERAYRAEPALERRLIPLGPEIASWCVDGALDLTRRGHYVLPPSHEAALEEWRLASDAVLAFRAERIGPSARPQGTSAAALYNAFRAFCAGNGLPRPWPTARAFSKRLAALGVPRRHTRMGAVWDVALIPSSAPEPDPPGGAATEHPDPGSDLDVAPRPN